MKYRKAVLLPTTLTWISSGIKSNRAEELLLSHWCGITGREKSLIVTNTRSLTNKMDEIRLRITKHNLESCVIIKETWLGDNTPNTAIELAEHSLFWAERKALSGKSTGGGVCVC